MDYNVLQTAGGEGGGGEMKEREKKTQRSSRFCHCAQIVIIMPPVSGTSERTDMNMQLLWRHHNTSTLSTKRVNADKGYSDIR